MRGVNKVILVGTLGQDPEVRYMQDGKAVATLSVATNEKYKDKVTGEDKEVTEWHRVVLWGRLAEIAGEYLRKGSSAYFEGKLKTRKWQDQSGVDRYTTEILASELQMLGSKQDGQQAVPQQAQQRPQQAQQSRPAQQQGNYQQPQRQPAPTGYQGQRGVNPNQQANGFNQSAGSFDDPNGFLDDIPL